MPELYLLKEQGLGCRQSRRQQPGILSKEIKRVVTDSKVMNSVKTGGHISCYQLKFRLFNSAVVLTKIKQFAQLLLSGNLSLPFVLGHS